MDDDLIWMIIYIIWMMILYYIDDDLMLGEKINRFW